VSARAGTFLGFDYGRRFIGIAVGGTASRRAEALTTALVRNGEPDWAAIGRLVEQWQPQAFVVGLPLNMDDSESDMTREAKRFGNRLRGRYNLPVHWVDERLTSVAAHEALAEAGVPGRRRKAQLDRLAAQTILQAFLDELTVPKPGP